VNDRAPLKSSIHRLLSLRVAVATAFAALALGTVAFFGERSRLEGSVADVARFEVQRFAAGTQLILDDPEGIDPDLMQASLEGYSARSRRAVRQDGVFVFVGVYGEDGAEIARMEDGAYEHIDAVRDIMESLTHTAKEWEKEPTVTAVVMGQPHVGVAVPLYNSAGDIVAHVEGVFAVSDEAAAAARRAVVRAVLYVVAIVLLTTLIIYPVISNLLGRLARTTVSLLDSNLETLQVLGSAIAKRDSDTDAHNFRVTLYAVRLAQEIGLSHERMRTLIKGSLLHDVGKIGIRDAVLLKPGKLSHAEYEVMKKHVYHGVDITSRSSWLADARSVVASHHEHYDGKGYPDGLAGEDIPVEARIFAIVDVFDALTSKRPYKDPFTFQETMQILREGAGSHFDPQLLTLFDRCARDLYDTYAGRTDETAREDLHKLTATYFPRDVAELID
jgi:HD-GYP domain-containing protein (c-di-GMP phosphodiesterase class II)